MSKEMIDSNISTSLYGEHMDFGHVNCLKWRINSTL